MVVFRRLSSELCSFMWESQRSALQTLHKVSSKAREQNYFQGGPTHEWVNYYEQRIESDRSCLNEWHAMDSLESRRPPSPDSVRTKPRQRDETEKVIRSTLKEIMMSVDLDEVTSKYIRSRLEEDLDMDLGEFKSFIDEEMLTILGQMDAPTEIFEHVYLGSEWNASNFEELQKNGVGHILNVTREIDNFFPGMFNYLNVRVYDDEKTDLLKYWDNTFKYITKAKQEGSKVLVHCKMGVSRSASVVIAYAMKAYNWDFERALKHVKEKRNCIKPNTAFIAQLETYQGILDAMKNKEKLQRSKSETNLKSPELVSKSEKKSMTEQPHPTVQLEKQTDRLESASGLELRQAGARPKSWSPENPADGNLLSERGAPPIFLSLENLSNSSNSQNSLQTLASSSPEVSRKHAPCCASENGRNVLMPLNNGQSYSVSPNQIVHLPGRCEPSCGDAGHKPCVRHRVNELELHGAAHPSKKLAKDKKGLVLNLTNQFEGGRSKPSSPTHEEPPPSPPTLTAVLVKKEIWDPGERNPGAAACCNGLAPPPTCDPDSGVVWTSSAVLKHSPASDQAAPEVFCSKTVLGVIGSGGKASTSPTGRRDGDPFSSQLDKVFDREERRQQRGGVVLATPSPAPPACAPCTACTADLPCREAARECPSRQSSWSSYDSAVELIYQGEPRDVPSRHSSWGSGDTRTLPSRNSSWGSYDMRPGHTQYASNERVEKAPQHAELLENSSSGMFPYDKDDIPWYPGTVKRTKQKLENGGGGGRRDDPKGADLAPRSSPCSDALLSDYPTSALSESEDTVEAFNVGLAHYCSSPVLCAVPHEPHTPPTKEMDIHSEARPNSHLVNGSRLSVSAPESSSLNFMSSSYPMSSCSTPNIDGTKSAGDAASSVVYTAQCSSVRQHKNFLENLHKEPDALLRKSPVDCRSDLEPNSCTAGIVKSLKREFEAKTGPRPDRLNGSGDSNSDGESVSRVKFRVGSVPSSPTNSDDNKESSEDVSVRELVGKYEDESKGSVAAPEPPSARPKSVYEPKPLSNSRSPRYSCIEVLADKTEGGKRLPTPPAAAMANVVVATVVKAASIKQQQRKDPRALNPKSRNSNPVYNTM